MGRRSMLVRDGLGVLGALTLGLGLAACAGATGAEGEGGTIELAVTTTCEPDSSPDCVPVGSSHVLEPDAFETAEVATASAMEDNPGVVLLDLAASGTAVLQELTSRAAEAGEDARLLIRAGGEEVAAPMVAEPITSGQVQLSGGPDQDADDLLALVRGS